MQPSNLKIGLVEDDPVMGGSIVQRLELEGYSVAWWQNGRDMINAAPASLNNLDLIVCDIRLPGVSGEEIFKELVTAAQAPPFVFVTGFGEIDQAVRLMRLGAADYLTKPFEFEDFLARIRRIADGARQGEPSNDDPLGLSPKMRDVETLLKRYAKLDLPVLITGESGVGKEVAAKHLHLLQCGAKAPFMAVNCAAIPAELLESEIFGHERGAFSGAVRQHHGYAERAAGGTLFLDEIGDMPLPLQAKILRLIEERTFFRIGGEKPIEFRARVVAATHQDLEQACAERAFREDLYFRVSALPLPIPPLRKRPDDLIWLTDRMLVEASRRQERRILGISTEAEEMILEHGWPGNARELRNRIERAIAVSDTEWIMPQDLFPDAKRPARTDSDGFITLSEARDSAERRQIDRALERTGGHVSDAAKLLRISRTTLWEKMTKYDIGPSRSDS